MTDNADRAGAPAGLPPVTPPSGAMILRMFLVPGLIVAVLVGLFLVGRPLYEGISRLLGLSAEGRRAEEFLRSLDNPNKEVRWRAASDLAQVLLRQDELAADAGFALKLADRLQQALQGSAEAERAYARRAGSLTAAERGKELKKLEPDRNFIVYLGACLGNFMVPVGAPLLKDMAVQESGLETEALAERRRRALWALATLGENLKRFDRLPAERQEAVLEQLESAETAGGHSAWARATRDYLKKRRQGKADALGVDRVLEQCAGEDDPSLRFLAAFASNFWHGTPSEEARLEKMLIRLSHDAGKGEEQLVERLESNPEPVRPQTRELIKKKGFRVQVNATIALARRGSPKTRLDLLGEMLDEPRLRQVFVLRHRAGGEEPNEAMVVLTLTDSLKALARLRAQRPEMAALLQRRFGPVVDELAGHANAAIRAEAKEAQLALSPRT
jgi:hypothetical protein